MKRTLSTLFLSILLLSSACAFPTPIERPKITVIQASELALSHHKEKYKNSHFEPYVVKAIYGELEDSLSSAGYPLRRPDMLKELREKTGWLIHVLRWDDLSQTDLYFIDQELKIEDILSTI